MIWWVQEEKSPEMARMVVEELYKQYFTQAAHPSSTPTLITALTSAGLSNPEIKSLVEDESEGLIDVKSAIR